MFNFVYLGLIFLFIKNSVLGWGMLGLDTDYVELVGGLADAKRYSGLPLMGNACASVLKTHWSNGSRESSENIKYRY